MFSFEPFCPFQPNPFSHNVYFLVITEVWVSAADVCSARRTVHRSGPGTQRSVCVVLCGVDLGNCPFMLKSISKLSPERSPNIYIFNIR